MKYRILCTDPDWLPKEGGGIKLWREDEEGRALWPRGEPIPLSLQLMRNLEEISRGISRFMKYWEKLSNEESIEGITSICGTNGVRRRMRWIYQFSHFRSAGWVLAFESDCVSS
jgi:hypothetical protein